MESYQKTKKLLEQLISSKKHLADTLVDKGEEASVNDPFDDLVEKAADYVPRTMVFVDEEGNEVAGTVVEEEVIIDATTNDVREGKTFVSDIGVKTGEKFIPSYHTTEGYRVIKPGKTVSIPMYSDMCRYTKLQALASIYVGTLGDSVSTFAVSINDKVYMVNSDTDISTITVDVATQTINFGITNNQEESIIIRYMTYKEED